MRSRNNNLGYCSVFGTVDVRYCSNPGYLRGPLILGHDAQTVLASLIVTFASFGRRRQLLHHLQQVEDMIEIVSLLYWTVAMLCTYLESCQMMNHELFV